MLKIRMSVVILVTFQISLVFCKGIEDHRQSNLENGEKLYDYIGISLNAEDRNLTLVNNLNDTQGNVTDIQASSSDTSNRLLIQLVSSSVGLFIMITLCSCCCYHCCCKSEVVEHGGVVIIDNNRHRQEVQQVASPPVQPIYIVQQLPPQGQQMQQFPPQQGPMPYQPNEMPPSYFQSSQMKEQYQPSQYQPMQMQQQSQYSPVYQQPSSVPKYH